MAAPAKFLFDVDFAAPASPKGASLAEIEEQIQAAERQAYARGFAEAQAEAEASDQRRTALALGDIGLALSKIASDLSTVESRVETEAVTVAIAAARKLAGALIAREPLAEISALIAENLHYLVTAPHLVVRVNDTIYQNARTAIEELAQRQGFEGRLVILADPDLSTGDCRIEWADGGITRDRAAIDARINELIANYLDRRRAGEAPQGDE